MDKQTIRDADLAGKRALVRVDFNVPVDDRGRIVDDTRIRASLPTIKYLRQHGAAVILASHLGRPKGGPDAKYSLQPVADHLADLLDAPIGFAPDCVGAAVEKMTTWLQPGEVLLLENVRFHPEEEKNDPVFAAQLARMGDLYVNDAFGSAHRAHASTEGVAHYLPSYAGFLMERELSSMGEALRNPSHPFAVVLGGAKVSDKIGVIANLIKKVDTLIIGGALSNTFLKSRGLDVGDSLVEADHLDDARRILDDAAARGVKVLLPTDVCVAPEATADAHCKMVPVGEVPHTWRILDIGPGTERTFSAAIEGARTIVWNGPMGMFELATFSYGTAAVARAICAATRDGAASIVGGGDSVAALERLGLADCFTHVSTGGGASLEYLEGRSLPGVEALLDRKAVVAVS